MDHKKLEVLKWDTLYFKHCTLLGNLSGMAARQKKKRLHFQFLRIMLRGLLFSHYGVVDFDRAKIEFEISHILWEKGFFLPSHFKMSKYKKSNNISSNPFSQRPSPFTENWAFWAQKKSLWERLKWGQKTGHQQLLSDIKQNWIAWSSKQKASRDFNASIIKSISKENYFIRA